MSFLYNNSFILPIHAEDAGATRATIAEGGTQFATAGAALEMASGAAADSAAGTGVRTITVTYLDGNYAMGQETVTMNGAAAVALVNTDVLQVLQVSAKTVGSGGVAAGAITCRIASGGATHAKILAGNNTWGGAVFCVPANKMARFAGAQVSAIGALGKFWVEAEMDLSTNAKASGLYAMISSGAGAAGTPVILPGSSVLIPEKTRIRITCIAGGAGTHIYGHWGFNLIDIPTAIS